jgi:histidine ammonia-lyase
MAKRVVIDGNSLTIEGVHRVARQGAAVALSPEALRRVSRSRRVLEKLVERGDAIYGVTTGVGELANVRISKELGAELQKRLVLSHAAGYGNIQPVDVVRAAMLLRSNTLAKGHSAVRRETLRAYLELLNRGVTPVVYEKGSLGASGDLSPLSQIAEVLMGGGNAFLNGEAMPGPLALKRVGLEPVSLTFKEGVGLINGSQMMTGELALRCGDAENILKHAVIAAAMSVEALRGARDAFDARIHELRPFPGQIAIAESIRRLTAGSEILAGPAGKVQDAYSLRCAPQIMGASLDALAYARRQTLIEMNSACDNPLLFPDDGACLAGGNFHGQPVAMAADFLTIAMSETASVSERRTNRLLNPALSGLPAYLVTGKGLNSGLMGAQITAAALVSENKVLSHPGVVDSISVLADEEDHVSMGPVSVRKLGEVCRNVVGVVAVELLAAAQGIDFRKPRRPGPGVRAAHREIRKVVAHLEDDRALHPDIGKLAELIRAGTIVKAVERAAGPINLGEYPY